MGKKVFVDGGILVTTPFFTCRNAGAGYEYPPEGSEVIDTNKSDEYGEYLLIDDENPQSIFNEYYAKTFYTTGYMCAELFYNDILKVHSDYLERMNDIKEVINLKGLNIKQRKIVNRLSYINIIASLETFICDIILMKITNDENVFNSFYDSIPQSKEKEELQKLHEKKMIGKWEQRIIEYVMKTSYSNIDTIKSVCKTMFGVTIIDKEGKMKNHFRNRHKLAHRNGRNKDNTYINITNAELDSLMSDSTIFIDQIVEKIK